MAKLLLQVTTDKSSLSNFNCVRNITTMKSFTMLLNILILLLIIFCHDANSNNSLPSKLDRMIGRDLCPVSLQLQSFSNDLKKQISNNGSSVTLSYLFTQYGQEMSSASENPYNKLAKSYSKLPPKCLCSRGITDASQAVSLSCEEGNFADIFVALSAINGRKSLSGKDIIFEKMIVGSAPGMSRLFGPLFHGKSIHSLSISRSNVSEISDEVFMSQALLKSLISLSLEDNSFTTVPRAISNFSPDNNITYLSLAGNQISSISSEAFKVFSNLTTLSLARNRISSLSSNSFSGLGFLDTIYLEFNSLAKFERNLFRPIAKRLRLLDVSHNLFKEVGRQDFNELGSLVTLNMSHNELSGLPRSALARVSQLMHLNLAANNFTNLDRELLRGVRFLKTFNLTSNSVNQIARGAFKSVTRIKSIDLSYNILEEIQSDIFQDLSYLEDLYLNHNHIYTLKTGAFFRLYKFALDLQYNNLSLIEPGAFQICSNITHLNLSYNNLSRIGPLAFGGSDQDQSDVTELDLSFNKIQSLSNFSVIGNFTGLKLLNLSHNFISGRIDRRSVGFSSLKRLYEVHTIDLSYNNITEITDHVLEKFASIRLINISHNSLLKLGSGSLGNLPTILTLDLSHNNISEVSSGSFVHLISLRTLYLQDNKLQKMFSGVPFSLGDLHLERNNISEISSGIFPFINSILRIYFDENNLVSIPAGAFRNLRSLQHVSFSHNHLTHIPREALQDCSGSLQNVSLDHNHITRLDRQAFGQLPIIFNVRLDYNEIGELESHAFDGLLQLVSLNMSYNNISKLLPDVFAGLVSLQKLDLSHNKILQLSQASSRSYNRHRPELNDQIEAPPSPLDSLLSIEYLDLSHNHISYLNDRSFPKSPWVPYKLTRVNLSDNPISVLAATRYIHKEVFQNTTIERNKEDTYTIWLTDSCRCTCPTLTTCIDYGKRATQIQPDCQIEFC